MGAKSNYLSSMLLNAIFNNGTFTKPTTLYLALFTGAGPLTAAGTGATEVSGPFATTGYQRKAVTPNTTNFPAATTSGTISISNGTAIVMDSAALAGNPWGSITYAAFYDSQTSGGSNNMLYYGALGSPVTVNAGNTFEFLQSGFSVTES